MKHPVYKTENLDGTLFKNRQNKLEHFWEGLFEDFDYLYNNNFKIRNKEIIIRIHLDQCMPYFANNKVDINTTPVISHNY